MKTAALALRRVFFPRKGEYGFAIVSAETGDILEGMSDVQVKETVQGAIVTATIALHNPPVMVDGPKPAVFEGDPK